MIRITQLVHTTLTLKILKTFVTQSYLVFSLHRPEETSNVYETEADHHLCLLTVIVEEDQINTLLSSPIALFWQ